MHFMRPRWLSVQYINGLLSLLGSVEKIHFICQVTSIPFAVKLPSLPSFCELQNKKLPGDELTCDVFYM